MDWVSKLRESQSIQDMPLATGHKPISYANYTFMDQTPKRDWVAEARNMKMRQGLSDIYTPVLEGAGAGIGGVLGATAGSPSGPGAAITSAAGGTLGYGIGAGTARKLDEVLGLRKPQPIEKVAKETGQDIITGATYEFGGQAIAPAAKIVAKPFLKGGKWAFRKVGEGYDILTKSGAEKKVGKKISAIYGDTEIVARNRAEANRIEKEVPGLKFSLAQATKDPDVTMLERSHTRTIGSGGSKAYKQQQVDNNEAIQIYYRKNFSEEPGIDDLIESLEAQRQKLLMEIKSAEGVTDEAIKELGRVEPQEAGVDIVESVSLQREPVKKVVGELASKIPDYPMQFKNVSKKINDILKDPTISENEKKAVMRIGNSIDSLTSAGKSTKRAIGVRKTINEHIDNANNQKKKQVVKSLIEVKEALDRDLSVVSGAARTGKLAEFKGQVVDTDALAREFESNTQRIEIAKANKKPDKDAIISELKKRDIPFMRQTRESDKSYIDRISSDYKRIVGDVPMVRSEDDAFLTALESRNAQISDILKNVEPGKDVAAAMKAYNDFTSSEYFRRFEGPALTRATRKGTRSENIPNMFATASGADDLIRAMGPEKAKESVRGWFAYDLMSDVRDSSGKIISNKLKQWVARKQIVLRKYGLLDEFNKAGKAQEVVDQAQQYAAEFEAGAAGRLLGADANQAIQSAFRGNAPGKAAAELMKRVKGDKAATVGLENAMADYFVSKSEALIEDMAGNKILSVNKFNNLMKKYGQAAKVVYRDNPKKLKALTTIQKAYEITSRSAASPIGGGSDTKELFVSHMISGYLSRTLTGIRKVLGFIQKNADKNFDYYMTKALFDTDYADGLIKMVRSEPKNYGASLKELEYLDKIKTLKQQSFIGVALGATGENEK